MPHQNIIEKNSPKNLDTNNSPTAPDDKQSLDRPNLAHKPSNFSIDHILNSAGNTKDKYNSNVGQLTVIDMQKFNNVKNEQYFMDSQVHQYPPILNWLQYTRYKPPRLPRKYFIFFALCEHTFF